MRSFFLALALALPLLACVQDDIPVLPKGPQTVQGVLQPTEISLVRRGSHLLMIDGKKHAYVESSTVHLGLYEGKLVTLQGTYELNTDPTMLPVFVVRDVLNVEETTKDWALPALGITVVTPNDWQRTSTAGKVHFLLPGKEDPVLTLYTIPMPTKQEDIPTGVSIVIDGKPAVRKIDEMTGLQIVSVLLDDMLLILEFSPGLLPEEDSLNVDWLNFLYSIRFDQPQTQSSSPHRGSGATAGTSCGGPAGILCPAGQYCEITDVHDDIGVCRPI